jgi:hypothetical protein
MGDLKKVIDKVNQFMDKIKMHGKEIRLEGDDCPCIIKQKLYNDDSHHLDRSSWIKKAQNVPMLHFLTPRHHGWCAPINLLLMR